MSGIIDPDMTIETVTMLLKRALAHNTHRDLADDARLNKRFEEGKRQYLLAAWALLGGPCTIPLSGRSKGGGVRWQPYIDLHGQLKSSLMGCYTGLAMCAVGMMNVEEALGWLEEVRVLHHNTRFELKEPRFEWIRWNLDIEEMTMQRVGGLALSSELFQALGNTGTAVDRCWNTDTDNIFAHHKTPELESLIPNKKKYERISLRHPDPSLTLKLVVNEPELQVLGSWKKLSLQKKGGMKARLGFASFIWNTLPAYPVSERHTGIWMCWNMVVHNKRAYLFTGDLRLDFFDLESETWGSVKMTYTRTLADKEADLLSQIYSGASLFRTTQQVVRDKLYVFGGSHDLTRIGCNLFMELDLRTMKWRRLSGTLTPTKADYSCPGPRRMPSSWVDKKQERIYLIGGEADRSAPLNNELRHHARHGYAYEDFWSWDIKAEEWRMERLTGNPPCPRSEAALLNPVLDKAVIFGGYNPALPTMIERGIFEFSYYADTFIYYQVSPSAEPKWKQVLTRGFPTYRAQSQLISDPVTGKMYLFGGYVNTEAVPSRRSRIFGDLWQLRINIPGGEFYGIDLEDEARTAMAGPWQRCFTCTSVGRWKKCGGSCKGHAFFCDPECLKDGWTMHKKMHQCQKVA
ncbi:hypothetical protein BDZ94DRAFT_1283075 [Collybia nuda]|uniref:MYND-type domain-containing protein n=1 Tax=Collybia nuda TaxID=64659 RepID=A0A9P6CHG8_9AGAR|nr:hypothetical protein BDZ94DRAFT_1283075 [Collybia nuda]